MNPIQQFNEANNCFYLDFTGGTFNESIGITFTDNNIYKAKFNGIVNNVKNATTIFPSTIDGRIINGASGYARIFCNKSQVTGISIQLGISGAGQEIIKDARNINLDASFLKQFPKLKQFFFSHYAYSRNEASLTGKITGDWAANLSPDIEILNLEAIDYPNSTATFNLNNIPAESKLKEVIFYRGTSVVLSSYLAVSGNVSNIPTSCRKLMLGGDRFNITTNNITGAIPVWVEEFSRIGRNTIDQNLSTLNPYIRHLSLEGSNVLSGFIPPSWTNSLNYLKILGKNTISGIIPSLSLCSNIHIEGNNTLSGSIPVLSSCKVLTIRGNNNMSGSIDIDTCLPSIDTLIIAGNNTISGVVKTTDKKFSVAITGNNTISAIESLPNCTSFIMSGKNSLTGNIFSLIPSATTINITGNNTLNDYSAQFFKANMSYVNIAGRAALTQPMVDQLLTDLAATSWLSNGTKVISIKGSCAAPSSAGLAKIEILREKGVVVAVNV